MASSVASQVEHDKELVFAWRSGGASITGFTVDDSAGRIQWSLQWSGYTMKMSGYQAVLDMAANYRSHAGGSYRHASRSTGWEDFSQSFRGGGAIYGTLLRAGDDLWHGHFSGVHTTSPADAHIVDFSGDYWNFSGKLALLRGTAGQPFGLQFSGVSGEDGQYTCHAVADSWRTA